MDFAAVATVHDAFAASAARRGDAPWLVVEPVTARTYGIPAGEVSYAAMAREVAQLRAAYAAAGYGHGHRVGLLLENRPAFFRHWFALNALGASVVPINIELRSAELAWLVQHSEMSLAVTLPQRAEALRAAGAESGIALGTWAIAADGSDPDVPFPRAPAAAPLAGVPIGRASECALLYTSGTTGRPKGCRLANGYFLRTAEWYLGLDERATVRRDVERIVTPLPLSHMNAMACSAMAALCSGGTLVQLDRFHPDTWWQSVRESGATILHYLGVMPAMLLGAPPSPLDRAHAVRWGFGAGVDKRHHAVFEERFGFPLVEAWAMTETGGAACIMANHEPRHVGTSCFGRAEPFVEVRLVDEAGRDVPEGEPGELLVRAAGADPRQDFFLGYLKDEAATEEGWAGGWWHTGDVVRRTPAGDFHFVDRRKNVIRRSGENISAVEVESVLNECAEVKASAVAATPDAVRGDEVLACIVLKPEHAGGDRDTVAARIVAHALARLAYYKAPGWVAFVDALPLTVSQKIQRGELKAMAQALPGQAHCVDTRALKKRQVDPPPLPSGSSTPLPFGERAGVRGDAGGRKPA